MIGERKKVCIIIPMYGQGEYTRKCIDTVLENAGITDYDILVVDDGSPEEYVDSRVLVLPLKENTGYTGATNAGILWAGERYEYLLLLNNDTEAYPGFLKELVSILDSDSTIAIASSVRLHPHESSYQVELYGIDLARGYQAVTTLESLGDGIHDCNWVPLCSALVRVDTVRELGILDKRMRTHSSDLDYCLRVRMAGYRIVVSTRSRVLHIHEVTTKANKISPEKDQAVLLEKLAGLQYAQLMKVMPIDYESKTYGKLEFTVYQK